MNAFEGVSRPVRAVGLGLIGLAVLAAVFGGVTLLTGNGSEEQTAAPTSEPNGPGGVPVPPGQPSEGPNGSTEPTTPGQPTPTPTPAPGEGDSPAPGEPTQPGGEPGQSGEPGQPPRPGGEQGGDAGDQQAAAKWVDVRVYNNSNIKGLAARAGEDLRGQGWNVAEFSNYSAGIIPSTTAYFNPGTDEETAARALAASFGMRVEPRFEGIKSSSPGVIVIVTNDYKTDHGKTG